MHMTFLTTCVAASAADVQARWDEVQAKHTEWLLLLMLTLANRLDTTHMCPPPLNLSAACSPMMLLTSPLDWNLESDSSAAFKPLTYVWWCLVWCSVMISDEMDGSSACSQLANGLLVRIVSTAS